jgi:putative adhesin
MASMNGKLERRLSVCASVVFAALACFPLPPGYTSAEALNRFERTYTPRDAARVTISNINGNIRVSAWDRKTIAVRAHTAPSVMIEDQTSGDDIRISVRRDIRLGRADFEVSVPADTSLTLKNFIGDIEVHGVTGHVSINSIDSNVRLVGLNSPTVDAKVTTGDIFFEGELYNGGSYSLQSMKGDIDVTVPAETPFNLNARALSENINLGSFLSSFSGATKGPKGVSGSHLNGGPWLRLTAYAGRILLHKK